MSQSNLSLKLGTRGSKLALAQANMVKTSLETGGTNVEIVEVKTSGDRIQDRPLADAGGKGLFTKELEEALLSGAIDLAVHSMKDVPVALPAGLSIAATLKREDPRDAFISPHAASLAALPRGARIGTSSVRRQAQVARARPDLSIVLLRGNVDTRLAKLAAGEYDAILLAFAGLKRLGLQTRITNLLDSDKWLPALAQGAIGIEIRSSDARVRNVVSVLNDLPTEIALACERSFQAALDGSCRTSIGGLARLTDDLLFFRGEVLAPDGSDHVETGFEQTLTGDRIQHAAMLGREAGERIRPSAARWLAL